MRRLHDSREGLPVQLLDPASPAIQDGANGSLRRLGGTQPVPAQRGEPESCRGKTTIADGTTLPFGVGVINRTNAAGQVTAVNTVREFSIVSGTSSVQNPYAEIDDKTSGGHDTYRALQMSLSRRLSSGLTLNSQYTFSRSFGNTSGSNEARTAGEQRSRTLRV
jgi:hypothetical protein